MALTYTAVTDVASLYAKHAIDEDILAQLDENLRALYVNTHKFARRTIDTADLTSDATLNADTELAWSGMLANEVWAIEAAILVTTTANADFRFSISTPDAAANGRLHYYFSTDTPALSVVAATASNTDTALTYPAAATGRPLVITGYIETGATPGSVTFNWAQGNSHADVTKLLQGSFLAGWRVDAL